MNNRTLQTDIRIHAGWTGDIADKRKVKHEEHCLPSSEPLSGRGIANLRARGKVASTSTGSVNQPKCLGIELWHPRGQQCLTTNYACREGRGTSSYTYVSPPEVRGRDEWWSPGNPGIVHWNPDFTPYRTNNFPLLRKSQKFWQNSREQYNIIQYLF